MSLRPPDGSMLTIGKIARRTSVTADTLRYYEQEGLLAPSGKTESGYRLYDHDCVRRVEFIRRAQRCGFTLSEIRDLSALRVADDACCREVRDRVIEKKLQIMAKIKDLETLSRLLDEMIEGCGSANAPLEACSILQTLDGPANRAGARRT